MTKIDNGVLNIFNASVVSALATLKVYAYRGKYIYNLVSEAFESAPDTTVDSDHEITATAIPNVTNPIGVELDLSDLLIGSYDIVCLDGVSMITGLRINKAASGVISVVSE